MEEVVGYANDTEFGLAAYVFSKNVNTLYTVSEALETGMVSCNTGVFFRIVLYHLVVLKSQDLEEKVRYMVLKITLF